MSETTIVSSARMSLDQLVARLDEVRRTKADFILPLSSYICEAWAEEGAPSRITITPRVGANVDGAKPFNLGFMGKGLEQLVERLPVPLPANRVRDLAAKYPNALANLITDELRDVKGRSMLRTIDRRIRAVLSDQYRILDHIDTAVAALDVARKFNAHPIECSLTDSHMRIKFTTKEVFDTINVRKNGGPSEGYLKSIVHDLFNDGDKGIVHPLVTITNSETGDGGLNVSRGIFVPRCRNGLVLEKSLRQVHVGKRLDEGLLSQEAIAADSKAVMLKARDIITSAFEAEPFKALMVKVHDACGAEIPKPNESVERVVSDLGLSEEDSTAILSHFLRDYDTTRFGLAGAISRHAQDLEPEKAAELEQYAGALLTA